MIIQKKYFYLLLFVQKTSKNRSQWLTLNRTTCLATQWEKLLPTPATCQGQTKSRQHRPKQQQTFLAQLTRANNTSTTGLHPSAIANCWLNFIKHQNFPPNLTRGGRGGEGRVATNYSIILACWSSLLNIEKKAQAWC